MNDNFLHSAIDAHQHFWQYNLARHSWINDEMAVIRKDFMPWRFATGTAGKWRCGLRSRTGRSNRSRN